MFGVPIGLCSAQTQDSVTPDRPGLGAGTSVVAPRSFQVEWGYLRSFGQATPRSTGTIYPELRLRTGITPKLEATLYWEGWEVLDDDLSDPQRSTSGIAVGGKYNVAQTERIQLTALAMISTPVGSGSSTSALDPSLGLAWNYAGKGSLSWFGAFQVVSEGERSSRSTYGQWALGANIAITERLGLFLEYFRSSELSAKSEVYQPINGGLTLLITPKIQFDLYAGAGLNRSTDHFVGTGLAVLF